MQRNKHTAVFIAILFMGLNTSAQNVGLGTSAPTERLHIHSGTTTTSATRYTNNATGTASGNGMNVGIQYQAGNSNNQYGYIGLQSSMPFYLWQGLSPRMQMDANGHFGIRTKPFNPFSLTIDGPALVFPGNGQPAYVGLADTVANNGLPVGVSMEKWTTGGSKHLLTFILGGDRASATIEGNFFNGTANNRTPQITLDSNGRIGMGQLISAKEVLSTVHIFGTHRIEGSTKYKLKLHSGENDLTSGSKIQFSFTPFERLTTDPSDFSTGYFIGLNDGTGSATEARAFTMGKTFIPVFGIGEFAGFVHNVQNQVGIRRYPEVAASNDIKIDMMGNTRFTASKITINRESTDPATSNSIELRNAGTYRYGFGYDVTNDRFFLYEGKSNSNAMLINNNRVGIAGRNPTTNALEVNGNASKSSAGDWLANSDARLKKQITPIGNALQKIRQLNGITYEWNDAETGMQRPTGVQMGFTAQNIQAVFPELVSTDAQGFLQTAYGTYDALYVEAIKALDKKIAQLEEKIKQLEITQPVK